MLKYEGDITKQGITCGLTLIQKAALFVQVIRGVELTRNNEIDEIKNGQEKIQDIKEKEE